MNWYNWAQKNIPYNSETIQELAYQIMFPFPCTIRAHVLLESCAFVEVDITNYRIIIISIIDHMRPLEFNVDSTVNYRVRPNTDTRILSM